jgi:hypothetical protein
MPLFAVIAPSDDGRLALNIPAKFPRYYKFGPGQYVVNAVGPTAQTVSDRISTTGDMGYFVVFSVIGFWGWHDKQLWEWLTLNSG